MVNRLQSTAKRGGDFGAARFCCCCLSATFAFAACHAFHVSSDVLGGGLAVTAGGGPFGGAALSKGVMAFGGGFAAGFPTAFPSGDAALGILFADFSAGVAFAFGPAEEETG